MPNSSARPNFAVDQTRTAAVGEMAPGVRENLSFWHIAPVLVVLPKEEHVASANSGVTDTEDRGSDGTFTVMVLYERVDAATDTLWILEYKCVGSSAAGLTKTMRWFSESEVADRYSNVWKGIMDKAGKIEPIKPALYLNSDASLDCAKMKAQYAGFSFDTNTPKVGGPTMAMLHDGEEPIAG